MKKILFAFIAMLAVSIAAVLFTNYKHDKDSLFYQNVEAIADDESTGQKCWNTITSSEGEQVLYCPECKWVPGRHVWYSGHSNCTPKE